MKWNDKSAAIPLLGLFLCIFGVKLFVILHHGNPTPFWDQWDAEAAQLYLPWENGSLDWSQFVAGHNEHRILWVRLLGLLELKMNGGIWDPLLQMTVNAGVHGLAIVLLLGLLLRELPRESKLPLILFSAVLALPVGWENTLAGFQSQFYFLILFSALSLGLLITARPLGIAWGLGFLALVASCFSTASGALAGLAVAACYGGQMLEARHLDRRKILAGILVLSCFLAAWALTPVVPEHAALKAASLHEWMAALAKSLAFPFLRRPLLAVVVHLPVLALISALVLSARSTKPMKPVPWVLLGAIIWVWTNAAATAYGRGAGGSGPVSRYLDTLALGNVLNFAAALHLVSRWRGRGPTVVLWSWATVLLVGWTGSFGNHVLDVMRNESRLCRIQEDNVRQFLADSNRDRLRQLPYYSLPYPTADRLADLLENATIRDILPTPLRAALAGHPDECRGFSTNGVPPGSSLEGRGRTWGSCGTWGAAGTGRIALTYDQPVRGHFLHIPVAGQLHGEGMVFHLEDLQGRQITPLAPAMDPGTRWLSLYVRNPGGPFRLVAEDHRTDLWFAFADPREVGIGTLLSKAAMRGWAVFVGIGLGMMLIGAWSAANLRNEASPS